MSTTSLCGGVRLGQGERRVSTVATSTLEQFVTLATTHLGLK